MKSLPLFPDLLEVADPFRRNANYLRNGHGVWSFDGGMTCRRRSDDCFEQRHLVVIYDNQKFRVNKTLEHWTVEIRHYVNTHVDAGRGKREMRQVVRYFCRHFVTRDEAIELAGKLLAAFTRVNKQ